MLIDKSEIIGILGSLKKFVYLKCSDVVISKHYLAISNIAQIHGVPLSLLEIHGIPPCNMDFRKASQPLSSSDPEWCAGSPHIAATHLLSSFSRLCVYLYDCLCFFLAFFPSFSFFLFFFFSFFIPYSYFFSFLFNISIKTLEID